MSEAASAMKFGSSAHTLRTEDVPLLTGKGRFTDDLAVPGQTFAAFVRSPIAHGRLKSVDTAAAAAMPGVVGIVTGADVTEAGLGSIPPLFAFPGRDGKPMFAAKMPPLAIDKVRYTGEPIAVVVAETMQQAMDAAEAVVPDIDQLPAMADVTSALAPGATPIWDECPGNLALDWSEPTTAETDAIFAKAHHVAKIRLEDPRIAVVSMEPRAAIATFDAATGRMGLIASTQGVAIVRRVLSEFVFKVPAEQIRVQTFDVGGGFGMKAQAYVEYAALLLAAKKLGRPVRWSATRLESFLADSAGRDSILEGELALDANGKFQALRMRAAVGIGAYTTQFSSIFTTSNTKNCLSSVYVFPAIDFNSKVVLTNAAPLGPYRGAGRPEAIYVIERLIDDAARALKIDRAELRRRNMIPASAMPYTTPNGPIYDSGDFAGALDKALAAADWAGFPGRRAQSEAKGKLRGIGIGCFLEVAGGILDETVDLRFEADGKVALRTGVQAMGQGHLSTFVPLIAARLGISTADVRLIQGDSDEVPVGTPSVASRSIMMAGSATAMACDQAIEKGKAAAAHMMEVSAGDVQFKDGTYTVVGTDRRIGILELAGKMRGAALPQNLQGGLDQKAKFTSPQMSFPNGCHICEVEIDPDTGVTKVVGYVAVDDVGNVLNETIVIGQIHGGVAQGLGQVLGEQVIYGADGQLLTGSFMDYVMPRADDMPSMQVLHHSVPCTTNPIGVKGAGESGVAGSLPSAVSAILDALSTRGVTHLDVPMTPERVWAALQAAR
jgi:carbon-monoxide dehydrogenase large subunit